MSLTLNQNIFDEMSHMDLQYVNPKSFSICIGKAKHRISSKNGSKLQFAVLIVLRQWECHVAPGTRGQQQRSCAACIRFLKWKVWRFFFVTTLFLLSAPNHSKFI